MTGKGRSLRLGCPALPSKNLCRIQFLAIPRFGIYLPGQLRRVQDSPISNLLVAEQNTSGYAITQTLGVPLSLVTLSQNSQDTPLEDCLLDAGLPVTPSQARQLHERHRAWGVNWWVLGRMISGTHSISQGTECTQLQLKFSMGRKFNFHSPQCLKPVQAFGISIKKGECSMHSQEWHCGNKPISTIKALLLVPQGIFEDKVQTWLHPMCLPLGMECTLLWA